MASIRDPPTRLRNHVSVLVSSSVVPWCVFFTAHEHFVLGHFNLLSIIFHRTKRRPWKTEVGVKWAESGESIMINSLTYVCAKQSTRWHYKSAKVSREGHCNTVFVSKTVYSLWNVFMCISCYCNDWKTSTVYSNSQLYGAVLHICI